MTRSAGTVFSLIRSFMGFCLIVTALLAGARAGRASENDVRLDDGLLLRLGDSFQREGEHYRAITEYKKLLILFPGSRLAEDALFGIGMSYFRGEDYAFAAHTFSDLRLHYSAGKHSVASRLYEGISQRRAGKYREAVLQFDTVLEEFPRTEHAPRALVERSLVSLDLFETFEMRSDLERFLRAYPDHAMARPVREALHLTQSFDNLPAKSPLLAGALSAVLPGSGYAYAGSYGDGITALVVNAVFIAGTLSAVRSDNDATALLAGGIGLTFYAGNIYGSANAARKWNLSLRTTLEDRIVSTLNLQY